MINTDEVYDIKYIDASGISTFDRCPVKYLFERIIGLYPVESTTIAPDFGTAIHKALPLCYDGTIDNGMAAFKVEWARLGYNSSNSDDKRNEVRAEDMLRNFAAQRKSTIRPYDVENIDIVATTDVEVSDNEVPFLIDIGGCLSAAGRIDAVVRWRSTGQLWALDYKTASEISARYFKGFENAPQTILYTVALSQIAGQRIQGMLIEALRVSPKNAETQLAFNFINDIQIESFLRQANDIADKIMTYNKDKKWPKKFTGCSSYGQFGIPGSNCPYLPLCMAKDWKSLARTYKHVEPFHPFKIGE
jgi:RecB family exonuclease